MIGTQFNLGKRISHLRELLSKVLRCNPGSQQNRIEVNGDLCPDDIIKLLQVVYGEENITFPTCNN